jgi:hypothetical protein
MRQSLDEWSTFILSVQLAFDLEDRLGKMIDDDLEALDQVKTLRDLAVMVEHHLPPGDTVTAQAIGMVKSAAEQIRRRSIRNRVDCEDTLNFDIPLLDAIQPRRWDV